MALSRASIAASSFARSARPRLRRRAPRGILHDGHLEPTLGAPIPVLQRFHLHAILAHPRDVRQYGFHRGDVPLAPLLLSSCRPANFSNRNANATIVNPSPGAALLSNRSLRMRENLGGGGASL